MSQGNVETFRRFCDAINNREPPEALVAPGFRIENIATAVTDKAYNGASGCLEWLEDMADVFADGARLHLEKILADRDDFVVAHMAFVGTGARSGIALEMRWISVFWFSAGKMAHGVGYATRSEALKAVGVDA